MTKSVRETFRQFLPGAGKDTTGNPKQGKTRVVGQINVTSYTTGGEALTPRQLGLERINWINLRCQNEVGAPDAGEVRKAAYNQTDDVFYLYRRADGGEVNEYADAATETVEYQAEGDSAYDVELH
jgi:hypothetical protein